MKVAICYSGNFRTFNECINNHAQNFNLLSDKIDVYFSTWSSIDYVDTLNDSIHLRRETNLKISSGIDESFIRKYIPKNWNLIKCKIDDYSNFNFSHNLEYQYFKIKDCFYLIDNPGDYDVIIRMRTDIKLNSFMPKDLFFSELKNNKIIINQYTWQNYSFCHRDMNEMLWFSNSKIAEKMVKILDNFELLKNQLPTNEFYGERICYKSACLEKIENNFSIFNFNYNVIR